MSRSKKLHLGCGLTAPDGWVNLDGSWNAWLAKSPVLRRALRALRIVPPEQLEIPWNPNVLIHDVTKGLPFEDNSFSAVYASHLLEHLYLEQAEFLLKECYRVLEPSGVLRIVVPDLRSIVLEYLGERTLVYSDDSDAPATPADKLNKRLMLRSPESPSGNWLYRLYTALKDYHSHKWMYDANSLIAYLRLAGFADVREMPFHESRIVGIEEVEQASRVLNGVGVCIEGTKP